jgi:hypothetical protein
MWRIIPEISSIRGVVLVIDENDDEAVTAEPRSRSLHRPCGDGLAAAICLAATY